MLRTKGFTLVELVAVIIILGILAAYAAPRFFSDPEPDLVALEANVISTLRFQQQRAMQDASKATASGPFYGLTETDNTLVGVTNCSGPTEQAPGHEIPLGNASVTLTGDSFPLCFNNMGCVGSSCGAGPVELLLSSGSTTKRAICINSQGYIRAGSCS